MVVAGRPVFSHHISALHRRMERVACGGLWGICYSFKQASLFRTFVNSHPFSTHPNKPCARNKKLDCSLVPRAALQSVDYQRLILLDRHFWPGRLARPVGQLNTLDVVWFLLSDLCLVGRTVLFNR